MEHVGSWSRSPSGFDCPSLCTSVACVAFVVVAGSGLILSVAFDDWGSIACVACVAFKASVATEATEATVATGITSCVAFGVTFD
jgi:hypothetical protein